MNLRTQSIVSELDTLGIPLESRSYLLCLAFARGLAYKLALPTAAVENPTSYFQENFQAGCEDLLAQINEKVVIDIDTTLDLTQRLWTFRYRVVFDAFNPAVRQFLDAVAKVGSRELPPKLSEWMIKYEQSDVLERLTKICSVAFDEAQ